MPKYQPLDLIGGFYTDDALSWSAQDTVNWLPLAAEANGTRTVTKLRSPPGLLSFSTLPSGPVRNTHDVEGRLFSVSGGSLYEVATSGAPTNRGAIPGVGRVSMAHNQISFGNQLTIVNQDSSGYVWNTATNTLTKITDPGFEGSVYVDFLDGYMIHTDPFGRWFFLSELADALNFNTFDRYVPEASPDGLVVARAFQGQIVAFNQSTIEFYAANTANPTPGDTFLNTKTVINKGCASRDSVARINNTLAWLADDGAVYVLNGYREQKISTVPLEQAFAGLDWSQAFAEVWEDQGHEVYYLTFPDGRTWGYDFASGLWTRRQSYERDRWRMNSLTFWNRKWIVGDYQQGLLYELAWGVYHENGEHLISERSSGYSHSNQNRVFCPYLELMFDTGIGESTPVVISGDLPDGMVSNSGTYQYTATGGIGTKTFAITGGSLPPGASMSGTGLVTYTYTTTGTFTWEVTATDVFGESATLQDSNQITGGALMATNLRHYTGEVGSMAIAPADIPWSSPSLINVVALSPSGFHLFGSAVGNVTSARMQILKYNSGTNTWSALPAPAVLPTVGPEFIDWHPSGNYVAIGVNVTAERVFVYQRSGDTFTKIAAPSVIQANQSFRMKWSPDGTRLACSNANTGQNLWVYDFDPATGAFSNGRTVASPSDQTNQIAWIPGQSRYLVRGNLSNMTLIDTNGASLSVVATQSLSGLPSVQSGLWFVDTQNLVTLGPEIGANGPVMQWTVNPALGASAFTFVGYPAQKTSILSPNNKQGSLNADRGYLAIARNVAAQPNLFTYSISNGVLTQYNGVPTAGTGTVTSASWRGEK